MDQQLWALQQVRDEALKLARLEEQEDEDLEDGGVEGDAKDRDHPSDEVRSETNYLGAVV